MQQSHFWAYTQKYRKQGLEHTCKPLIAMLFTFTKRWKQPICWMDKENWTLHPVDVSLKKEENSDTWSSMDKP